MSDEEEEARWEAFNEAWETTERKLREALPPELRQALDRPMYYSPDGEPLTMPQWSELMWQRHEEARINGEIPRESWWCRKTFIGDMDTPGGTEISTVWLGLDHNYMLTGPPLIWETMIFGGEWDQEQWRYHTRAAAFDHHEEIVRALRAGRNPNNDAEEET